MMMIESARAPLVEPFPRLSEPRMSVFCELKSTLPTGVSAARVLGPSRALALATSLENARYPRKIQTPRMSTTAVIPSRMPRFQPIRRRFGGPGGRPGAATIGRSGGLPGGRMSGGGMPSGVGRGGVAVDAPAPAPAPLKSKRAASGSFPACPPR